MWLLMLEAGVALFLLVFIVWWTMFHGNTPPRPLREERPQDSAKPEEGQAPPGDGASQP